MDFIYIYIYILLSVCIYIYNFFFCVHVLEKSQVSVGKGNARKDERIFQSGNAPVAARQLLRVPSPTAAAACPPTAPQSSCSCSGTLPALRPRTVPALSSGDGKHPQPQGAIQHTKEQQEGGQVTAWL